MRTKGTVPSDISDTVEPKLPKTNRTGTLSLPTAKKGRTSSAVHSESADTHRRRGSLSRARGTDLRMFLCECGKEFVWVSSFVCALVGCKSFSAEPRSFLLRVAHSLFSFFVVLFQPSAGRTRSLTGITSWLRSLRRSARGFNKQTAARDRDAAQAASYELQPLGRLRPFRSTTRRAHLAAKVLFHEQQALPEARGSEQPRPPSASFLQQRAVIQRELS